MIWNWKRWGDLTWQVKNFDGIAIPVLFKLWKLFFMLPDLDEVPKQEVKNALEIVVIRLLARHDMSYVFVTISDL